MPNTHRPPDTTRQDRPVCVASGVPAWTGRLLWTCSHFKFSVGDSSELSGIQFTPPKRTRNGQDSFVVSCVAVWISFYPAPRLTILIIINTKNCSLSTVLTATHQKPQKSLKRWYYPPSHCLNVNVMLSNMTFLMILAVFDVSPLTLWINCSF